MSRTIALIALAALATGTGRAGAADRPNILWITCEDLSPHLGCYGDDTVPTPRLDRLASEGPATRELLGSTASAPRTATP